MSNKSILKKKSFDFAVRVINLSRYLKKKQGEYEISGQVLRSGTAIGALIREAEHAESRKDFIHKLTIGLKEANESLYWIELLHVTKLITTPMFESLMKDGLEILKILISSIKSLKSRL